MNDKEKLEAIKKVVYDYEKMREKNLMLGDEEYFEKALDEIKKIFNDTVGYS